MTTNWLLRLGCGGLCAGLIALAWPLGSQSARILALGDDPVAASEAAILMSRAPLSAQLLAAEIDAALNASDADLAASFIALADAQNIQIPPTTRAQVALLLEAQARPQARFERFADGFFTGRTADGAALAGAITGDLFVYGDLRDLVREGLHSANGQGADPTLVMLAGAGIAVSAGTYVAFGAPALVRAGLSTIKAALRAGVISSGMLGKASGRHLVNPSMGAVSVRASSRAGLEGLVQTAQETGRIQQRLGTRAAFDALKIVEKPKDIARVARLMEARGPQTRALLKLFGRGALVLGGLVMDLAGWLIWLVMLVFGLLCWIKSTSENLTTAWLRRRKARMVRVAGVIRPARRSLLPWRDMESTALDERVFDGRALAGMAACR